MGEGLRYCVCEGVRYRTIGEPRVRFRRFRRASPQIPAPRDRRSGYPNRARFSRYDASATSKGVRVLIIT